MDAFIAGHWKVRLTVQTASTGFEKTSRRTQQQHRPSRDGGDSATDIRVRDGHFVIERRTHPYTHPKTIFMRRRKISFSMCVYTSYAGHDLDRTKWCTMMMAIIIMQPCRPGSRSRPPRAAFECADYFIHILVADGNQIGHDDF